MVAGCLASTDGPPWIRTPMSLTPGQRLGVYEVSGLIGEGGMGQVWRARDTRLGRDVALKTLPDAVAAKAAVLIRFQREARAVAALNHPNVVTIHAVDDIDGVHYLAMELVEGQSLSQLIAAGPMPIDRFFTVVEPLADALTAAHACGVIHRDLKPANIMVTDAGRVKVLDFGLASLSGPAADLEETLATELTQHGSVVGTLAYMAPERFERSESDHRSDIFALGVIMYELLTGHRPFAGPTAATLMACILRDEPPPLSSRRGGMPELVAHVVHKCLEKLPANRYQGASALLESLQRARRQHDTRKTEAHATLPGVSSTGARASIAVLPFTNLSADPENDFFADGIAEEIINVLGQIRGLRVAARTSSFSFKGKNIDLREVGEQLGVSTVLEGGVRKAGKRLRITTQLVNTADGYQLWSERLDREMEDVFAVQDEIARTVAERLKVSLSAEQEVALVKPATDNLEAYELYLKGRALLYKRGVSIPAALTCLKQAVALDPGFAQAWAGVADGHTILGQYGFVRAHDTMPHAKAAANRAVTLDDSLAEAHAALAGSLLLHDFDVDGAERELRRALELNPEYIQARGWYALFVLCWIRGRFDEAVTHTTLMRQQDPLSAYTSAQHTLTLGFAGRFDEAFGTAHEAVARDPASYVSHWAHQFLGLLAARYEQSLEAGDAALAVSGRHPWPLAMQVSAHLELGHRDAALACYDELVKRAAAVYVQPFGLAWSAAALGMADEAVALAEQALADHDASFLVGIRYYPHAEPLRQALRRAGKLEDILAGVGG